MPTITEVVAYGLVGTASVVSLWRLGVIIWKTRRRRMSVELDLDTSGFAAHIERLSSEMQAQIERRIGEMGTEDIVRAMMGREMARHLDDELMTGVEGTTESLPPDAIPYTTSHTRPPEHRPGVLETEATRVAALLGVPYSDALAAVERAVTEGTFTPGLGRQPFIDPATGRLTDTDPSEPPPVVYVWQDGRCPIECHIYDPTHDLHEAAHACYLCERYAVWYHAGGARQIPQGHELVEPPTVDEAEEASMRPEPTRPEPPPPAHPWQRAERCFACPRYDPELGPLAAAGVCRGDDDDEYGRPWRTTCTLYAEWSSTTWEEDNQDLAPSDVETNAAVTPRCPWMTPDTCDACTRRTPRILPGTQAVLCAGHDDDPSAFECAMFDRWREANPTHHMLGQLLHREKQAALPSVRVIRFRPDK